MNYVVDSGIFMNLHEVPQIPGSHYITTSAINEIKSSNSNQIFDVFRSQHDLSVLDAEEKHQREVQQTCREIGQTGLSIVDKDVLALLFMMMEHGEVILLSDDYALRNIAHAKNIESKGFKTQGGNQLRKYKFQCNGCKTVFNEPLDECDVCGHSSFKRWRRSNS